MVFQGLVSRYLRGTGRFRFPGTDRSDVRRGGRALHLTLGDHRIHNAHRTPHNGRTSPQVIAFVQRYRHALGLKDGYSGASVICPGVLLVARVPMSISPNNPSAFAGLKSQAPRHTESLRLGHPFLQAWPEHRCFPDWRLGETSAPPQHRSAQPPYLFHTSRQG